MTHYPWQSAALGTLISLLLSTLLGCDRGSSAFQGPGDGRPRERPLPVRVVPAKLGNLMHTIPATGTALPRTEVKLSSRAEGQIAEVWVREGDRVARGDLLLRLDDSIYRHQYELARAEAEAARARLDKLVAGNRPEDIAATEAELAKAQATTGRAEAEVRSAQAKLEEAQTNARAFEKMFQEGVVSSQQRLSAQTLADAALATVAERQAKLREDRAALEVARARLQLMRAGSRQEDIAAQRSELARAEENAKLLGVKLGYAEIRAPISGVISERRAEPGDLASVGSHLLTLVDTEVLKIRTRVSELDLSRVRHGQPLLVEFDAFRGKSFEGQIINIFPTVDPSSRQATVEVEVKNPGGEIPSGILARMKFISKSEQSVLLVPKAALLDPGRGEGTSVYVAKPGGALDGGNAPGKGPLGEASKAQGKPAGGGAPLRAELRRVKVGEARGDVVEVREGLEAGELVIIEGQTQLRPGGLVQVVP